MSKVTRVEIDVPSRENVGRVQDLVAIAILRGGFRDHMIVETLESRKEELLDEFASFFLAFICARGGRPVYSVEVDGVIRKFVLMQPDVPVIKAGEFLRIGPLSSNIFEIADEKDLRLFVGAHPYIRHEYIISGGERQEGGAYSFNFVRIRGEFRDFRPGSLKHLTPRYHYLARVRLGL